MSTTNIGLTWIEKDQASKLNYEFDLSAVVPQGDQLSSVVWRIVPNAVDGVVVEALTFTNSVVRAVIDGGSPGTWYSVAFTWTTLAGLSDDFVARVFILADQEDLPQLGSALFPNRFSATEDLRRDRLAMAAATVLQGAASFSDDYVWQKLLAAESEVRHKLRVPLQPTYFFPTDPSDADVAALAGMPWEIDPGYDYEPSMFASDSWGHLALRNKPIVSVDKVRIQFPAADTTTFYDLPQQWYRMDRKYGQLQFVPTAGQGQSLPLNVFMLQAMGMGRSIPLSVQVFYTAGIVNAAAKYPELVDVVRKKAVLSMIDDLFLPQSSSISGDGLSQSLSVDMEKYRDTIDHMLFGPKGRNGGLMTAIHGVRLAVI